MHEAGHGAGLVMGNARLFENAVALRRGAEPHGEEGLAAQGRRRPRRIGHRLRHRHPIGQGRGAMEHHDRVIHGIGEQGRQRGAEPLRIRIAHDINGIGAGPGGGPEGVERRESGGRELRQLAAEINEIIHSEHADAAPIGENGQPVARERRHPAQRLGRLEQLVDIAHPQQARAAEGGVIDRIRPRHGARMSRRRLGRARVAPGLDDDDRLDPRSRPRRRHEALGVPDGLHIEQDRPRGAIEREPVEQRGEIHIRHVADGDQPGKADAPPRRKGRQRSRHRPRLGDDRQIALARGIGRETGVEPAHRRQHPQTIGPHHANARARCNLPQLQSQRSLPMGGIGGNDDSRLNPARRRLLHQLRHRLARGGDDEEIGRLRQVRHAGEAGAVVDQGVARVDEMDRPGQPRPAQIVEHRPPKAARPRARPRKGDGAGLEEGLELVGGHGAGVLGRGQGNIGRGS